MSVIAVSQSNYIPWKGYFDMIRQADVFVVYDEVQYTKRDWRNRNRIKTPRGIEWLSVPVKVSGKYFQKISETEIAEDDWGEKHWTKLLQSYKQAPYFAEYREVFEPVYHSIDHRSISDINQEFIRVILDLLEIKTKVVVDKDLQLEGDRNERLLDACKKLSASVYLSGPAAKTYLDESIFNRNDITVEWMDYNGYPEYPQLHGPFDHHVSILDLLFNTGSDAITYLDKEK